MAYSLHVRMRVNCQALDDVQKVLRWAESQRHCVAQRPHRHSVNKALSTYSCFVKHRSGSTASLAAQIENRNGVPNANEETKIPEDRIATRSRAFC